MTTTPKENSGEKHPRAKFTNAQIYEIRRSEESLKALASRFGVHPGTICKIRKRALWAHLPPEEEVDHGQGD
jgi:hypothetical protein